MTPRSPFRSSTLPTILLLVFACDRRFFTSPFFSLLDPPNVRVSTIRGLLPLLHRNRVSRTLMTVPPFESSPQSLSIVSTPLLSSFSFSVTIPLLLIEVIPVLPNEDLDLFLVLLTIPYKTVVLYPTSDPDAGLAALFNDVVALVKAFLSRFPPAPQLRTNLASPPTLTLLSTSPNSAV